MLYANSITRFLRQLSVTVFPKDWGADPQLSTIEGWQRWWGWMRPLQGLQVIVTCFRGDEGTILSSSISLLPHHRDEKVPTATCCYHTALPHRLGSNQTNRLKTGNPKTVTFALHVSITLSKEVHKGTMGVSSWLGSMSLLPRPWDWHIIGMQVFVEWIQTWRTSVMLPFFASEMGAGLYLQSWLSQLSIYVLR